jgi:hypothetical protein
MFLRSLKEGFYMCENRVISRQISILMTKEKYKMMIFCTFLWKISRFLKKINYFCILSGEYVV